MTECAEDDSNLSVEERLTWLRERGVVVETPEERKGKKTQKTSLNEKDEVAKETISFVLLPHDTSRALEEFTFDCPIIKSNGGGDQLLEYLKPIFAAMSAGKDVDLELFRQSVAQQQTLASSEATLKEVSQETLRQVAQQGNVEKFTLVNPTASNKFVGVNIYLDEVGMLKRLPLNTRAGNFAERAGYNPTPQFYGDVFLGRIKARPFIQNIPFTLGQDTSFDAPWLKQAMMDNLAHQTEMNKITGRNETQESVVGTDGKEKKEDGYTWTQTEEELEIILLLSAADHANTKSKDLKTKIMPKSIQVKFKKDIVLLSLTLFECVDPDGCTWTIEREGDSLSLILTLEKAEQALWPRIED